MTQFSAHIVTVPGLTGVSQIDKKINLYVAPNGDDVVYTGLSPGSPFRSPARAFEYLADKTITDSGFVTINFAAGTYDIDDELIMDHPQGDRIALVGAEPETLVLKYVDSYATTGFTATALASYYSTTKHSVGMNLVKPDDSTLFVDISSLPYGVLGAGVLVEDYQLVHKDDYNPTYFYASYPSSPRNNIVRQASILGAHKLTGVSGNSITVESTVRDDWMCLPFATINANLYGNPQNGVTYISGYCGNAADQPEPTTQNWFGPATNSSRRHWISSVPIGYYGTPATSGMLDAGTANFVGATFPIGNTSGATAAFTWKDFTTTYAGHWYSSTGTASTSMLNEGVPSKNYHEHYPLSAAGSSANWRTVNSNTITVKILPTVFRRFGNILSIRSSGLRKIKNIFFDGRNMFYHYNMISYGAFSSSGYSNKMAIHSVSSKLGETVSSEPENLGVGLCSNVGVKDFHTGFYADSMTRCNLGKLIVSNCSFGVVANNGSVINTKGSVCTGMASVGFGAMNESTINAQRCFTSFTGQSIATIRMKTPGLTYDDGSFIPGQTFASPDGKLTGTVWDWDSRQKVLQIAVRVGAAEGGDPLSQR